MHRPSYPTPRLERLFSLFMAVILQAAYFPAATAAAQAQSTVQFAAVGYTSQEGGGGVTIRVERSGDTSAAAAVDYSTRNITASSLSDYTESRGTLRFAAGESAKSFTVLVTDDALVEGSEVLGLTLNGPAGATLGFPSSAALAVVDNDSAAPAGNRIDEPPFFVIQNYFDFLNRVPDGSGLDFWANQIKECGTNAACIDDRRTNVSAAFYLSIEFQQTGFLVYRAYAAAFGRTRVGGTAPLTLGEFLPDTQQIGRGVVVNAPGWEQQIEQNKQAYFNEFAQRPQFLSQYPQSMTALAFVNALNANTGNSLTTAERDALVAALAGGTRTRAQVLRAVAENNQFGRREFNRAFVLMQYFGYLRRNPHDPPDSDFGGYNFWLAKLNQFGGDFRRAEMVRSFLVSGEYRSRFGCNVRLSSVRQTFDAAAAAGSVRVTPTANCPWKAVSADPWLTISGGGSGAAAGTLSYSVAANTSDAARFGTLYVNGLAYTVTQAGAVAPTAPSLLLSKSVVGPGETFRIEGAAFDPQAQTSVVFSGPGGYRVQVPAWSVTPTAVQVVAPVFVDTAQGTVTGGTVKATIFQSTPSQARSFGPSPDLQIVDLPPITWTPGVVTLEVFKQMQVHAAAAVEEWKAIQTASGGSVDVAPMIASLTEIQKNFADREAAVSRITSGAAAQVALGKYNGRDVVLTRDSVILMDRLYYAFLLNNAQATQTSAPSRLGKSGALVGDAAPAALTDEDIARSISTAISQAISETRDAALANASRLRALALGGVAVAYLIGAIPATPALVLGAIIYGATTWPTIANTLLMRSVSRQMQNRSITVDDFKEELDFAVGLTHPTPDDVRLDSPTPDGQVVNNTANTNADFGVAIAPTLPDSVGTDVADNFGSIIAKLPPPTPAAITVGDNGFAADDAFEVTLDGVVLGRTAVGASNTLTVPSLAPGPHSLQVTCITAPDNVGTYEVSLSQGVKFTDGSTYESGELPQGGSASFTIIAP